VGSRDNIPEQEVRYSPVIMETRMEVGRMKRLVVSVRREMMSITVEMTRPSMERLTRAENHLTGKKEVGRAMSNCIEKLVRRTFGRDDIHWLELVEASVSTNKCLNKISDTMIRLKGSAIENPWNRKLRKTQLYLSSSLFLNLI